MEKDKKRRRVRPRSFKFFIIVPVLFLVGTLFAGAPQKRPVIVIDPGHGGNDPGAIAHGVREEEIVLQFSRELKKQLEKRVRADVVLTRSGDRTVSLESRNKIANRKQCDLFLSLHANAARNARAHGIEIYSLNKASDRAARKLEARENRALGREANPVKAILSDLIQTEISMESRELAGEISKSLKSRGGGMKEVRTKTALFYVLVGTKCPSLLIETGFLTNPEEAGRMKKREYQRRFGEAVAEGVALFWRGRGDLWRGGGDL